MANASIWVPIGARHSIQVSELQRVNRSAVTSFHCRLMSRRPGYWTYLPLAQSMTAPFCPAIRARQPCWGPTAKQSTQPGSAEDRSHQSDRLAYSRALIAAREVQHSVGHHRPPPIQLCRRRETPQECRPPDPAAQALSGAASTICPSNAKYPLADSWIHPACFRPFQIRT